MKKMMWAKWQPVGPELIEYACTVLGITEADCRRMRMSYTHDIVQLQQWNPWRKFTITGLEQVTNKYPRHL